MRPLKFPKKAQYSFPEMKGEEERQGPFEGFPKKQLILGRDSSLSRGKAYLYMYKHVYTGIYRYSYTGIYI